ncbi:heavy-metal-associated domain-containing protein [Streptomyces sp. D2-8]|uniref:heavy-metal-associated domain-containing protein n=1 Tax=Streptomyces sp. D2-8 TaxID=2707767 RepID=UPI0020BDF836|nr:cation transporter [Streptomyces sp. D2-8]MCK8438865.1 heavy-metal-associated domain-containing protein [Streptomyces sp. D2-8]
MVQSVYDVKGMTCNHCVQAAGSELNGLSGVKEVQVDLPSGKVTVTSEQPLDPAAVAAAVDEAGYELVGDESRRTGGRNCCAGPSAIR